MEKVADNYDEDHLDEDDYEHSQVCLLIILFYTTVLYIDYCCLKSFILTLTYEI